MLIYVNTSPIRQNAFNASALPCSAWPTQVAPDGEIAGVGDPKPIEACDRFSTHSCYLIHRRVDAHDVISELTESSSL